MIDKSAAFDCVNMTLLLKKLKLYGLDTIVIQWCRTYLENRTQYVHIAGQSSTMRQISHGVPQGLVLRPIMLTIFMNKMLEATKDDQCSNHDTEDNILFGNDCTDYRQTPAYADDATHVVCSRTRESNQQKMSNNLQSITNYLQSNQLSVNQDKMQLLKSMVHQKR